LLSSLFCLFPLQNSFKATNPFRLTTEVSYKKNFISITVEFINQSTLQLRWSTSLWVKSVFVVANFSSHSEAIATYRSANIWSL